jgi:hypothetical protein
MVLQKDWRLDLAGGAVHCLSVYSFIENLQK